jgi:hypothetical protein
MLKFALFFSSQVWNKRRFYTTQKYIKAHLMKSDLAALYMQRLKKFLRMESEIMINFEILKLL